MVWLRNNIFCIMIIVVIVLFIVNLSLIFLPLDNEERGTFGDQFGAVNALFSGLAFAGLIYTIVLQRNDLKLQRKDLLYQRKELELTRKEMEEQTAEFQKQNNTLKIQRFENTFFNMMSLFQNITDNFTYENPDGGDLFEAKGRDVFKKFYLDKDNFNGTRGVKGYLAEKGVDMLLNYDDIEVFNHYFHFFDGIVIYIDNTDLLEHKERYQYFVMLRNMLSDNERYIMFYYYAACGGWHKQMAEEYALFHDVNPKGLASVEHFDAFAPGAYDHYIA